MANHESPEAKAELQAAFDLAGALKARISGALRGKPEVVELAVVAFLAGGHLLVEDVPGVGKTTLARSLADALRLDYRRVQFTSDLLPADLIGANIFDRESGEFRFRAGPVFCQLLLADEINRTTPRTQSALLEAMGEGQVSIDGETHTLPSPFFVVATQNPSDFHGTYPLPESQLDRFLFCTSIGYPPAEVERALLASGDGGAGPESQSALSAPVGDESAWRAAQRSLSRVRIAPGIIDFLHKLILATREHEAIAVGASTRAALAFERALRARALSQGRDYCIPDDVKRLAVPTLAHRLRLNAPAAQGGQAATLITRLANALVVPI